MKGRLFSLDSFLLDLFLSCLSRPARSFRRVSHFFFSVPLSLNRDTDTPTVLDGPVFWPCWRVPVKWADGGEKGTE